MQKQQAWVKLQEIGLKIRVNGCVTGYRDFLIEHLKVGQYFEIVSQYVLAEVVQTTS